MKLFKNKIWQFLCHIPIPYNAFERWGNEKCLSFIVELDLRLLFHNSCMQDIGCNEKPPHLDSSWFEELQHNFEYEHAVDDAQVQLCHSWWFFAWYNTSMTQFSYAIDTLAATQRVYLSVMHTRIHACHHSIYYACYLVMKWWLSHVTNSFHDTITLHANSACSSPHTLCINNMCAHTTTNKMIIPTQSPYIAIWSSVHILLFTI